MNQREVATVLVFSFILAVLGTITLALLASDYNNSVYEQAENQVSREENCSTQMRAFGYDPSTKRSQREDGDAREKRAEHCKEIRAVMAAEKAAALTQRQVLFGVLSFGFIVIATGAAVAAAWFTRRQADIANQSFRATHRPKIVVHRFQANTDPNTKHIGASFSYVNAGVTQAKIVEIGGLIFIGEKPPAIPQTQRIDNWLASGEARDHTLTSEISDLVAILDAKRTERGFTSDDIMCIGYIRYEDERGIRRETGFCRSYDVSQHAWLRVKDTDYEYSY